jgi:hypothetical protein
MTAKFLYVKMTHLDDHLKKQRELKTAKMTHLDDNLKKLKELIRQPR